MKGEKQRKENFFKVTKFLSRKTKEKYDQGKFNNFPLLLSITLFCETKNTKMIHTNILHIKREIDIVKDIHVSQIKYYIYTFYTYIDLDYTKLQIKIRELTYSSFYK